jgi:hypothetical protein
MDDQLEQVEQLVVLAGFLDSRKASRMIQIAVENGIAGVDHLSVS